jgi:hypothetical protein
MREIKLTLLAGGGRIKKRRVLCLFMNINVWIAGRLLKSAVVFLMQISQLPAPNVRANRLKECCQNFTHKHLDNPFLNPADTAVVAIAAAAHAGHVIINHLV